MKPKKNYQMMKVDLNLYKELCEVQKGRMKLKGENVSLRRITKGIPKHSFWNQYKKDLMLAEMEEEKSTRSLKWKK